jgi:hypothetical protein
VNGAAFLIFVLGGLGLMLGGLVAPFGAWQAVRTRVRFVSGAVVLAAAPVAFPFILKDRVVLVVYGAFALGALVWSAMALKNRVSKR